jgi:hypothetical protein
MYHGPITPEEAVQYSQRLQEARIADPNAQLQVDVALPPEPQLGDVFFELAPNGTTKAYVLGPDGSKQYFPPTSAALYLMSVKRLLENEIISMGKASARSLALAAVVPPQAARGLLTALSTTLTATIFADIPPAPSPQCDTGSSTDHCRTPDHGSGSGSDKGDIAVFIHDGYDYAPAVLYDGGIYKMWWCGDGNTANDKIFYAESTSSPFLENGHWTIRSTNSGIVFSGSGVQTPGRFDGAHTCDPSVVKVGAMYYMYYGGNVLSGNGTYSAVTRIGVAYSYDGISWTRARTTPLFDTAVNVPYSQSPPLPYGAGHPSVVFVSG